MNGVAVKLPLVFLSEHQKVVLLLAFATQWAKNLIKNPDKKISSKFLQKWNLEVISDKMVFLFF